MRFPVAGGMCSREQMPRLTDQFQQDLQVWEEADIFVLRHYLHSHLQYVTYTYTESSVFIGKQCLLMCGVSDGRCTGFTAVRRLFASGMVGFLVLVVCAIVYVIRGDARPLLLKLSPCNTEFTSLLCRGLRSSVPRTCRLGSMSDAQLFSRRWSMCMRRSQPSVPVDACHHVWRVCFAPCHTRHAFADAQHAGKRSRGDACAQAAIHLRE